MVLLSLSPSLRAWNTSYEVAREGAESNCGVLLGADVPAARFLGVPRTGYGGLSVAEVVVLGGADSVLGARPGSATVAD